MNWFRKLKILSDAQMKTIHEASLHLLKTKGVVFRSEKARNVLKDHGAKIDGEVVFFPEELVEKCLKSVPGSFRVDAVNPE